MIVALSTIFYFFRIFFDLQCITQFIFNAAIFWPPQSFTQFITRKKVCKAKIPSVVTRDYALLQLLCD